MGDVTLQPCLDDTCEAMSDCWYLTSCGWERAALVVPPVLALVQVKVNVLILWIVLPSAAQNVIVVEWLYILFTVWSDNWWQKQFRVKTSQFDVCHSIRMSWHGSRFSEIAYCGAGLQQNRACQREAQLLNHLPVWLSLLYLGCNYRDRNRKRRHPSTVYISFYGKTLMWVIRRTHSSLTDG